MKDSLDTRSEDFEKWLETIPQRHRESITSFEGTKKEEPAETSPSKKEVSWGIEEEGEDESSRRDEREVD